MKKNILKLANILGEYGVFSSIYQSSVPVFLLHRVSSPEKSVGGQTIEYIGLCLEYLKKNRYKVFTLSEYFELINSSEKTPKKSCIFTIDDGFIDHFENAGRIFDFYSFPLNYFLITGFLDKEIWPWDDQIEYALENTRKVKFEISLPDNSTFKADLNYTSKSDTITVCRNLLKGKDQSNLYSWITNTLYKDLDVAIPDVAPQQYSPMSWDQARSLAQRGHELYPHSHTHRILSRLNKEQQKIEIQTSINRIKEELKFDPPCFSYSTGRIEDYSSETIEILKSINIRQSFTTIPGYLSKKNNPLELPRFGLPSHFEDFKQIITKFEAFKESVR